MSKKVLSKKFLLDIKSVDDFIKYSDFKFDFNSKTDGRIGSWSCILKDTDCLKSKGGVYMIVNKASGYKYIGSSRNLYRRFRAHFSFYFNNSVCIDWSMDHQTLMKREMTEYGILNFEFNVHFSEDKEGVKDEHFLFNLLEKECEYNLIWPKRPTGIMYSIDKRGNSIEFNSIEEASDYHKLSASHIWRILDKKKVCIKAGVIFSSICISLPEGNVYFKDCFNKLSSEDREGNIIYFLTAKEAAFYFDISLGVVYRSLKSGLWVKKKTIRFNWVKLD